jgi:hypothetical protein
MPVNTVLIRLNHSSKLSNDDFFSNDPPLGNLHIRYRGGHEDMANKTLYRKGHRHAFAKQYR